MDQAVREIVDSGNPGDLLFAFVGKYHLSHPALAIATFESVSALLKVDFYWTLYQVAQAYRSTGDATTAFLIAARADHLEPTFVSWHLYHIMFHHHVSRGRDADALVVLRRNVAKSPENLILSAAELERFLLKTGKSLIDLVDLPDLVIGETPSDAVTSTLFAEASELIIPPIQIFGPDPLALSFIAPRMQRSAINVIEITNATVIIQNGTILVLDSQGVLYPDLCRATFPLAVLAHHRRLVASGTEFKTCYVAEAIVIADMFNSRNVCHFLLDYMARVELFQKYGCDIANVSVITEPFTLPFMKIIAKTFSVNQVVSCEQQCVLQVGKLLLTDDCKKAFQHPGHYAAPWAVGAIRRRFGAIAGDARVADQRVYLSRGDATGRRIRNETEVVVLLEARGFVTVLAANLTYEDQVSLFRRTTHVVSAHGAGLANIVFCPPGANILEIFHPVGNNPDYAVVAAGVGLNYAALTARDAESSDAIWNDPSLSEADRARAGGREGLNYRDTHVPVDLLSQWLDAYVPLSSSSVPEFGSDGINLRYTVHETVSIRGTMPIVDAVRQAFFGALSDFGEFCSNNISCRHDTIPALGCFFGRLTASSLDLRIIEWPSERKLIPSGILVCKAADDVVGALAWAKDAMSCDFVLVVEQRNAPASRTATRSSLERFGMTILYAASVKAPCFESGIEGDSEVGEVRGWSVTVLHPGSVHH